MEQVIPLGTRDDMRSYASENNAVGMRRELIAYDIKCIRNKDKVIPHGSSERNGMEMYSFF